MTSEFPHVIAKRVEELGGTELLPSSELSHGYGIVSVMVFRQEPVLETLQVEYVFPELGLAQQFLHAVFEYYENTFPSGWRLGEVAVYPYDSPESTGGIRAVAGHKFVQDGKID